MKRLGIIGLIKTSAYLRQYVREDLYVRYAEMLFDKIENDEIKEYEDNAIGGILEDAELNDNFSVINILNSCQNNIVANTLLQLAVMKYINPQYSVLLNLIFSENGSGVSIYTASIIAAAIYEEEILPGSEIVTEAYNMLENIFLTENRTGEITDTVFKFDSFLSEIFLKGKGIPAELSEDCELYGISEAEELKFYGYREEFSHKIPGIIRCINEPEQSLCITISGEKGSGKKTHVKYLVNEIIKGSDKLKGICIVSYSFMTSGGRIPQKLKQLFRTCYLYDYSICISDIEKDENTNYFIERIMQHSRKYLAGKPLFLLTEESVKVLALIDGKCILHKIKAPKGQVAHKLWEGLLKDGGLKGYDVSELSSILCLNAGQLKKAISSIDLTEKMNNKKATINEIYQICYSILDDGRYDNVHRVEPGFSLDDLKLDIKQISIIKDICNQVKNRYKVYSEWGMSEKYAYGRCVSILLAGPPGTGKTMAVHAIAKELGLEMYKVDLSRITDKYIGETEKRLAEVFEKAERSNMLLFFDEADAVMGKRTDTTDAHDKSSNAQIAYILQRMEEYDGIVALATNLIKNIDSAFMRRIRYVLKFEYPPKSVRKEIWISSFANGVPRDEDIDYDYLAETFEITGALIKNIILNSTFYAAAEDCPVAMKHIMKAVVCESVKDAGILMSNSLGKYEYLTKSDNLDGAK